MIPRPITPTVPLRRLAAIHHLPVPSYALGVGLSSRAGCSMPAFKRAPDRLSSLRKRTGGRMRVGVAGLGVMGAAVAARLMEVGHEVTVWNRTPEKTKALADSGAKVASTPAQLASAVEATITMLTDAAAIDAVYNGPGGLLSGDVKGKLLIEMSTVPP